MIMFEKGDIVKVLAEKGKIKSNEITIVVDSIDIESIVASADATEVMRNNFYDRPEIVYRGVVALMAGNVNYLFD